MAKISTYPLEGSPKLSDKLIGTSVGLNQIGNLENPTYNFSLQQLLDLFSPLLPGNTLQGVLDNNNTATEDINLNGTVYTVGLEVSSIANIFSAYISDSIYIEASLFDRNNSQGTAGQILKSTGNGVEWFTPSNTIPTLQQVLTSGNEADVDMILTANLTADLITANDILVQDSFELSGTFLDSNGLAGTSGQMLISLGTGVEWQNVPVYTASSPLFINPATKNITIQQANGTQNGYLSYADWITFNGKQNALSGTGIVVSTGGTISYITNNSLNWDRAYNDSILSAAVTGTTTKTLTLTQRDGDTITASWTEGGGGGGISSIGLTMPAAFTVTNSPLTANGTIAVSAAGSSSQYIKGDGTLGTLPSTSTFVPYTGATANVNLGEYEIKAGQMTLDITPTGVAAVGTTQWNNDIGSSQTLLKGGIVLLKNGVDLVARVVNKVTPNATLLRANYQAVRVSGAQGQRLAVAYAQANSDNNSADTIGLVCEDIATNQEGFIMTVGQLLEVNTTGSLQGETWVDGDVLYLSPTTPGKITNIKPTGLTGHIVVMGYVEYAHAVHGSIYVKIMNGWELDELHNVYINPATLANGDLLQYNSSNQLWENKSLSASGIQATVTLTTTGTSGPASFIGNVLNIPQYAPDLSGYVPTSRTLTINGTAFDLSANRSWSVGTVTSVGLTSATSGITIGSSPVTSSGSITLAIATASGSQQGLLSSTDWTTFNNKQNALTNPITGTGTTNYIPKFTGASALGNSLIFDNGTNVGIGTATPTKKLDVNGDALINSLTVGRGPGSVSTNTVFGYQALNSNTLSTDTISIGYRSLYSLVNNVGNIAIGNTALYTNYGGTYNLAIGHQSLYSLTLGNYNTAIGNQSLYLTTTGSVNVAIGVGTLVNNTTGNFNTAVGANALNEHIASGNTAVGYLALAGAPGSSGGNNVAVGANSLSNNQTGSSNIAIGWYALNLNTTGAGNVAIGDASLQSVTYSNLNIAIGSASLGNLLDGDFNTCIGYAAGGISTNSIGMTLIGYDLKYKPSSSNIPLSNNELAISQYWSEFTGKPHFYAPDKIVIDASTNTEILSVSSDAYNAFFVDYSFDDASGNLRAGTIKCIFTNPGSFQYQLDDQATTSIGTTSDFTFDVIDDGNHNAVLRVVNAGGTSSYIRFTSRLLFKTI